MVIPVKHKCQLVLDMLQIPLYLRRGAGNDALS